MKSSILLFALIVELACLPALQAQEAVPPPTSVAEQRDAEIKDLSHRLDSINARLMALESASHAVVSVNPTVTSDPSAPRKNAGGIAKSVTAPITTETDAAEAKQVQQRALLFSAARP